MTFDQTRRDLLVLPVKYGARSDVGHHAYTLDHALPVVPVHERHGLRQRRILTVQAEGLKAALARADSRFEPAHRRARPYRKLRR